MIFNKVYRGEFLSMQQDSDNNPDQKLITINIYDALSGTAVEPTTIIPLELAETPAIRSVEDNEEDKFTARRSKRLEVNIHSSDSIGLETFIIGGDNRFYIELFEVSKCKFRGWLSVADTQEDLLPDPNIISLIATDGLSLLDNEPLVNDDDENPSNENTIMDYLRWCVRKTGIERDIYISMNVREKFASSLNSDTTGEGHFFKYCYLDARTFEAEIGISEDCGTVLDKLLGPDMMLTTMDGDYYIMLIDEFRYGVANTFAHFDSASVFVEYISLDFTKSIGITEDMGIMDEDMIVGAEQPVKSVITTFNYNYPSEIPCNKDFSRGEGDEPTGAASETIDYVLECWRFLREGTTPAELDSQPFTGSVGVLRKLFELNYEKERYLVLLTAGGFRHYFKSEAIAMRQNDKINIGFDYRFNTDEATVTLSIAHIRLVGDDGNVYDWKRTIAGVSSWVQKTTSDPIFTDEWEDDVTGLDNTEWRNVSAESLPAPASGRLYIRLLNAVAPPVERWFSNLQVTHIPFVNGSYQKYKAHTHTVTQEGTNKAKREEDVSVSDGPNSLIKGVLLKKATGLEIYSGEADFANTPDSIQIDGDKRNIFSAGMKIIVSGSTLNDGEYTIISVSYALFTDLTTILVDGDTTLEINADVTINLVVFVLTEGFYDAFAYPDADYPDETYIKPYGEMQAFWLFNQVGRRAIKLEGKIDGLSMNDADGDIPDLMHKYYFTDADSKTVNRIFQLIHFEQDLNLCEWTGFFIQVDNNGAPVKIYTGHTFKYITE
jgi:hypothetical protein